MTVSFAKGKELLIVSFSYSPMLNPRAFRWTALAEEFARRGVRVRVVCSWQPGLASTETINGVEIHRVGIRFIEHCRALLARFRAQRQQDVVGTRSQGRKFSLTKSIGWVWRQIVWPDTTCVWYGPALRRVNALLQSAPGATVVTVTPSFTASLVGASVVRRKMVKRWIMDMGDPFTLATESPVNNFFIYGVLNRSAEHAVIEGASAVALTNRSIKRKYAELYPEFAKKFFVIPPLLPENVMEKAKKQTTIIAPDAVTRLIYVGSLYKSLRRPDFLLALFVALTKLADERNLELHFYGNTDECVNAFTPYTQEFGRMIKVHGLVTQEEAFAAIGVADLVINLGNANPCQLPSKIIEYMALGKPILNIVQTDEDPSQELMQGYRCALTISAESVVPTIEQINEVRRFIEKVKCVNTDVGKEFVLDKFKLTAVANQYSELMFGE